MPKTSTRSRGLIANMKRLILGNYHSVSRSRLYHYLVELQYRTNRHWGQRNRFDRLVLAAVSAKPLKFQQLPTGVK